MSDEVFFSVSIGWYGLIKFLIIVSFRVEGIFREYLYGFKFYLGLGFWLVVLFFFSIRFY